MSLIVSHFFVFLFSRLLSSRHFNLFAVAPEATDNTAENQPADDPRTAKYTWRIESFSRLSTKKLYSEVFELGDYKW